MEKRVRHSKPLLLVQDEKWPAKEPSLADHQADY